MAAGMDTMNLLCLAVMAVMVQLSYIFGNPPINLPPFIANHMLEISTSSSGEVLEGKYDLHPPAHNRSWILGFYFLTTDHDTWQAGVVINHNTVQGSVNDSLVMWCDTQNYTTVVEPWANISVVSQGKAPLTLTLQLGSAWVKVTVTAAGGQQLQVQHNCLGTFPELSQLKLTVSCHDIDCGLNRKKCEMVMLPRYPNHRLELSSPNEGEKEVLEVEFDFHSPPNSTVWMTYFDLFTVRDNTWVTTIIMKHDHSSSISEDILYIWKLGHGTIVSIKKHPWAMNISKMKTPLTLKLQVVSSGMRLYETTAGQTRLVEQSNLTLAMFPDLWLGVRCWSQNECGSLSSSSCRKDAFIMDCHLDHDTTLMMVTRMMIKIMFVLTTAVSVVLTRQYLHHLNTILHYLTLLSERGHYDYDDQPEDTDAPQPPNTTTSPKIILQKPTRPLPPIPSPYASSASQSQLV